MTSPRREAPEGVAHGPTTWGLSRGDALGHGRFVLTRLSAGRKSEVYLAWDRMRRSTVVAKLRPDRSVYELRKEADLLERLRHPLLVRGLDAALDGPTPHLVLEHLDGPSLRGLVRQALVPVEVLAAIGLQIATVLHYLATEGFVHLDVKPHNILVAPPSYAHSLELGWEARLDSAKPRRLLRRLASEEAPGGPPTVKLIDVAAVKAVGSLAEELAGEVPEHRAPGARIAPPAGVWLLGATMWRALTGSKAPGGDAPSPAALDPTAFPADVPEEMVALVSACLREDPSERPSAEQAAVALESLIAALPRSTRRPAGRFARRPRLGRWSP